MRITEGKLRSVISNVISEMNFVTHSDVMPEQMHGGQFHDFLQQAQACIRMAHDGSSKLHDMCIKICAASERSLMAQCMKLCMCACKCDIDGCCRCLFEICQDSRCAQICFDCCDC